MYHRPLELLHAHCPANSLHAMAAGVHGELAEPAMDLVVRLRQYIEEVLTALIDSTFEPFPRLREAVKDQMQGVLHKQELGTKEHVSLLIRWAARKGATHVGVPH